MWEVVGHDSQQGVQSLQAVLIAEIENLQPAPNVPSNARIRLIYEVLSCRYLKSLTQEEAAKCVGITSRTLRRIQQQAIHLLAQQLWEASETEHLPSVHDQVLEPEAPLPETDEWQSQLKTENLKILIIPMDTLQVLLI